MFKNLFKSEYDEELETEAVEYADPERDMWAVFQIIKNKDKREFNRFIKGTEALYNAWANYQTKLSQDEAVEQDLVSAEDSLDILQGEA